MQIPAGRIKSISMKSLLYAATTMLMAACLVGGGMQAGI